MQNFRLLDSIACRFWVLILSVFMITACEAQSTAPQQDTWQRAGTQGLVQFIIVPQGKSREREAYDAQIKKLCDPDKTCFLNFYTNTTNAPLAMPLPDAIDHEATALYRRSMKNGVEKFQWSCRLKVNQDPCF